MRALQVSRRCAPYVCVVQDAEVVISSKDRAAHVYQTEHKKLWRSLVGFSGSRELADDAVSEAFAQLIVRGDAIRDPRAWVWKVAFQIAAGELQRRGKGIPPGSERSYDMPEPLFDVLRALTHLGPKQRLAVVLHDYADRPTQEIAGILGVTRATVHAHLSQGRAKLRKQLEVHDDV
jgi:RNA polymerase sigma-70 factor, ECF subfamily